jgi:hypothetical protein
VRGAGRSGVGSFAGPAMATASTWREATGTEREWGERETRASARLLHSTRQHAGVVRGDDGAWAPRRSRWGCQFMHGRHASSACHPLRHFVERVVGNALGKMDASFRPLTGRISERALNEV